MLLVAEFFRKFECLSVLFLTQNMQRVALPAFSPRTSDADDDVAGLCRPRFPNALFAPFPIQAQTCQAGTFSSLAENRSSGKRNQVAERLETREHSMRKGDNDQTTKSGLCSLGIETIGPIL